MEITITIDNQRDTEPVPFFISDELADELTRRLQGVEVD